MKILIFITVLFSSATFAKSNNTGTSSGRYQIIQLSEMARHQYMIDTQTGKIWNKVCAVFDSTECASSAWVPEDVVGITITAKQHDTQSEKIRMLIRESKSPASVGSGQ